MNQRMNPLGSPSQHMTPESSESPSGSSDTAPCESSQKTEQIGRSIPEMSSKSIGQRIAVIRVESGLGDELPEGQTAFSDSVENDAIADDDELIGLSSTSWLQNLNGLVICIVVIVSAAFLLVTLTQTSVLIKEINSWIQPAWTIGWLALAAIWTAVIAASIQLARAFLRYRQSPAVSLSALEQLRDRELGRAIAARSHKGAADKVRLFLQEYPDGASHRKFLSSVMDSRESVETLLNQRRLLLADSYGVSSQWLQQVQKHFTCVLDDAANVIIRRYSFRAGIGTALSPRGAIDVMIVLLLLQRMTTELCHLYGVRPGRMESLVILGHIVVAATLAAKGEQAGEIVDDQIKDALGDGIGRAGAGLVGKFSGRAAEGAVNSLFLRRVGRKLREYLRPIRE